MVVLVEEFQNLWQVIPQGGLTSGDPQSVELACCLRDALNLLKGQIRLFLVHLLGIETHGAFRIATSGYEEEHRFQFALRAHGSEGAIFSFLIHV